MITDLDKMRDLLLSNYSSLPKELALRGQDLLRELEMCKNESGLTVKLAVISKALRFFADKTRYENVNKLLMMAVSERDRLRRLGRIPKDDRRVDTVRSVKSLP